jgi:hypothetical protein
MMEEKAATRNGKRPRLSRKRQKVKTYFLPVENGKAERSSPFLGVKARKSHRRMGSALVPHGLKRRLCRVSNPRQTGKKQGLFF